MVQEVVLVWCLPTDSTSHSCSYAALVETLYGVSGVPKDAGSHTSMPRHQRVCQLCGTNFGDDLYLAFECAALADLRGQLIYTRASDDAAIHMAADSGQVANFLTAGIKIVQTVGSDEGSNV